MTPRLELANDRFRVQWLADPGGTTRLRFVTAVRHPSGHWLELPEGDHVTELVTGSTDDELWQVTQQIWKALADAFPAASVLHDELSLETSLGGYVVPLRLLAHPSEHNFVPRRAPVRPRTRRNTKD